MSLLDSYSASLNLFNTPSPELTSPKSKWERKFSYCQVSLPSISDLFPNHFSKHHDDHDTYKRRSSVDSYSRDSCHQQDVDFNNPNHMPVKGKRKRANSVQIRFLNRVFETTAFPSTELRSELGKQLGMSPRAVQIWFQNKRQSLKGNLPHGDRDSARRISISLHSFESNLLPKPTKLHSSNSYTFYH
ncbi:homeobox-domain-containing protein [Neoconidiobolus thromboides FSU 785]|nr:homeobox-domain-containing protein [Neoconidiobolus thromboides FSU 785]